MAQFLKIGGRADLPEEGQAREFTVDGKVICVARVEGALSAMDNVCPHRGGPLGQGVVMDGKLICPWPAGSTIPRRAKRDTIPA